MSSLRGTWDDDAGLLTMCSRAREEGYGEVADRLDVTREAGYVGIDDGHRTWWCDESEWDDATDPDLWTPIMDLADDDHRWPVTCGEGVI